MNQDIQGGYSQASLFQNRWALKPHQELSILTGFGESFPQYAQGQVFQSPGHTTWSVTLTAAHL